ncbi:hypothetical protein SAMN04489713_105349 [Actinomadura madurae]|uniref:Uncharacterized protein n=1 Tax=Actinomadura madurae TaxID=1993 RepID=A0A1I5GQM7_9ACTN|nr:hypothetical protein SAMN04489713_105349 [Actinomadura madurae]
MPPTTSTSRRSSPSSGRPRRDRERTAVMMTTQIGMIQHKSPQKCVTDPRKVTAPGGRAPGAVLPGRRRCTARPAEDFGQPRRTVERTATGCSSPPLSEITGAVRDHRRIGDRARSGRSTKASSPRSNLAPIGTAMRWPRPLNTRFKTVASPPRPTPVTRPKMPVLNQSVERAPLCVLSDVLSGGRKRGYCRSLNTQVSGKPGLRQTGQRFYNFSAGATPAFGRPALSARSRHRSSSGTVAGGAVGGDGRLPPAPTGGARAQGPTWFRGRDARCSPTRPTRRVIS